MYPCGFYFDRSLGLIMCCIFRVATLSATATITTWKLLLKKKNGKMRQFQLSQWNAIEWNRIQSNGLERNQMTMGTIYCINEKPWEKSVSVLNSISRYHHSLSLLLLARGKRGISYQTARKKDRHRSPWDSASVSERTWTYITLWADDKCNRSSGANSHWDWRGWSTRTMYEVVVIQCSPHFIINTSCFCEM